MQLAAHRVSTAIELETLLTWLDPTRKALLINRQKLPTSINVNRIEQRRKSPVYEIFKLHI
jgi:hypothetical protein